VIGPAGNDGLVMDSIIGGARAYLDLSAGPRVVREAIEVVSQGPSGAAAAALAADRPAAAVDRRRFESDGASPDRS